MSLISFLCFLALMTAIMFLGEYSVPGMYALSFWHYLSYWLAYYYGTVELKIFKNDAVVMKTISLVILAYLYLAFPLDYLSLSVVAAGFLLNIVASSRLGPDRTYYGYELTDMPHRVITGFPYSLIPHPMLSGNILAYAGTLINDGFRQQWWSLAVIHIALNFGLIFMETRITFKQRRPGSIFINETYRGRLLAGVGIMLLGALAGGVLGMLGTGKSLVWISAVTGALIGCHAFVMFLCYSGHLRNNLETS